MIVDSIIARDGTYIKLIPWGHASVSMQWQDFKVSIDPVGLYVAENYSACDDLVLLTHHHADHLDDRTISRVITKDGLVIGTQSCKENVMCHTVVPMQAYSFAGCNLETVPAYNVTPNHVQYHPKERGDVGYVLNIGGSRIYFAGDTEDVSEVCALRNIDVAFLPVNQPYTMTIDQVVHVAREMRPKVLYPYHYGSSSGVTDVTPLVHLLKGVCEVRIRSME